jgi:hypothetical protein
MRLLLDECVPRRFRRELPGHQVRTVPEAGWAGLKNGALLRAANDSIDVLITVDQGVEHQQNLTGYTISVVVLVAPSNDLADLQPLVPALLLALATLRPGSMTRVGLNTRAS